MKYMDELRKAEIWKTRIIKSLVRAGIFPDHSRIEDKLKAIDLKLSILQYKEVSTGDRCSAKKYNEDLADLYQDLLVLYKIAYELSVKRFEDLCTYAEVHLAQLERLATHYDYKTRLELDSTYLGDTVLYQSSGFDMQGNNGVITINLGSVRLRGHSKVACIFEADNVTDRNVVFSFRPNDVMSYQCSPYSYNNDMWAVPGEEVKTLYLYEMPDTATINTSFIVSVPELTPDPANRYELYGGQGFISKGYLVKEYAAYSPDVEFTFSSSGILDFWIVGGTFATFDFNMVPLSVNFSGTKINNMSEHQHIVIEYPAGFTLSFRTDGTCYATKQTGIVSDGNLIYPASDQVKTILVEEYSAAQETEYQVTVTINNVLSGDVPRIKAIALKCLHAAEV